MQSAVKIFFHADFLEQFSIFVRLSVFAKDKFVENTKWLVGKNVSKANSNEGDLLQKYILKNEVPDVYIHIHYHTKHKE